jgi:hypothetical protein
MSAVAKDPVLSAIVSDVLEEDEQDRAKRKRDKDVTRKAKKSVRFSEKEEVHEFEKDEVCVGNGRCIAGNQRGLRTSHARLCSST